MTSHPEESHPEESHPEESHPEESHPEEWICAYRHLDPSDARRAVVEEHLATCAACRATERNSLRIDAALRPEPGPVTEPLPEAVRRRLATRDRRTRQFIFLMALLVLLQVGGGALVIWLLGAGNPPLAGILGGGLIADSGLVLAVLLLARERRQRLDAATAEWSVLAREWREHLRAGLRADAILLGVCALGMTVSLVDILRWSLGSTEIPGLVLAFVLPLSLAGTVLLPRKRARYRSELAALEAFAVDNETVGR